VYSTCSLEREENEQVVASVLADLPQSVPVESVSVPGLLERLRTQGRFREGVDLMPLVSGNMLRTLPGSFEGDGFFAAVFERR
jgi:16S rRNA C967 or C1407 C5-methylase (RsmB/RsmF family)